MAQQLRNLGVDILEAGFAIASPGDFQSVKEIAAAVDDTVVASLSRALTKDIDAAWEAVKAAKRPRIHTFLATSDLHLQYKLKMTREHGAKEPEVYEADKDAVYTKEYDIDLSQLKSTVAFPHLPENTHTFDDMPQVKIDQVVIGSCTNGRLSDLEAAAAILKGRKVAKGVRCIILPATQRIWQEAMHDTWLPGPDSIMERCETWTSFFKNICKYPVRH